MTYTKLHNSQNPSGKGQLINSAQLSGPAQMAADMLMLEKANSTQDFAISIRFYKWEGTWLSIGHHQKHLPKHWIQLLKEKEINIVRRPSGGNAVLHSGGLTYALVWKSAPRKKLEAYFLVNQWLINCFSNLNFPLQFGEDPTNLNSPNCFGISTEVDLIDAKGSKRIGSAQYWKIGNLLQHGHILLDPPEELWVKVFKKNAPKPAPRKIHRECIESSLLNSLKTF